MITLDPDKVCSIILRARVFENHLPEDDDDPGSDIAHDELGAAEDQDDDEAGPDLDGEDGTREELMEEIDALAEDEQIELVALAWLGRGSYTVEEWKDALAEAANAHNDRTAEYLIGMPLLADYLEEGLAQFGISCSD